MPIQTAALSYNVITPMPINPKTFTGHYYYNFNNV